MDGMDPALIPAYIQASPKYARAHLISIQAQLHGLRSNIPNDEIISLTGCIDPSCIVVRCPCLYVIHLQKLFFLYVVFDKSD
jgi:hypothetical protein